MNKKTAGNRNMVLLVKALTASYILTGIILLILAFLLYKMSLPDSTLNLGIIAAYLLSAFVGGFIVGKAVEEKKFVWGLILGILYFAVLLVISIVINKAYFAHIGSLVTVFAMCSLGGMLGGMLS